MTYKFLEDRAIADVAFEACGKTLAELFQSAALALANTMVRDTETLRHSRKMHLAMSAASPEMLLYDFLQELIYLKDARLVLFARSDIRIEKKGSSWRLSADMQGDDIDPGRQELLADVKAVSLHRYKVEETTGGWRAEVILDV